MSKQASSSASSLRVYLRLLSYVKSYWLAFAISIIGYVLFALSQPAFAQLIKNFVDGLEKGGKHYLYLIPAAAMIIAVIRGFGSFLGSYYLSKVANGVVHDLRTQMFNHLVDLPNAYFDSHSSGHLISRITYNVTMVTGAATDAIKVVIREGFTVFFLLGYLFWINWRLTLVFLLITPVIIFMVSQVGRRLKKLSHSIQDAMGDITHISSETINNYKVVRGFGGEAYERKRFLQASLYNLKQSMRMVKTSAITTPVLQFIIVMAMAIVMFLVLFLRHTSDTATLIAFVTAIGMLPKPIRQLSEVYGNIQKGIAAAENIFAHLDEPVEENKGSFELGRAKGKLEFINVSFAYPNSERTALKSINFTVEPGKTVALVGKSGSGKTTLSSLIPLFYNNWHGEILLDGVNIKTFELKSLRKQISLVNQHVSLFNDTVARNIAYGSLEQVDEADIHLAAEAANAMEFIKDMPEGFNTLVGENGVLLSGGQRQRLAIARAILKDSPLLILDEATSALDTESERVIQNALDAVMQGRTTLVIAHRLSTIENADKILVMDEGSIVESGTHQQLLAQNGVYTKLHSTQLKQQKLQS